jgi:hypothetical protein
MVQGRQLTADLCHSDSGAMGLRLAPGQAGAREQRIREHHLRDEPISRLAVPAEPRRQLTLSPSQVSRDELIGNVFRSSPTICG